MADFDWVAFAASLPWTVLAVLAVFGATFVVARAVGKHAVVDVTWGLGFPVIAVVAYAASAGQGDPVRAVLVLLLSAVWGLRLSGHIALRARGRGEDPRYADLMSKAHETAQGSGTAYALRRIYLPQAAVMWFVSLPLQVAMFQTGAPGLIGWLGVALWAIGFGFETVGDHQLQRFRDDPTSQGQVLDTGLWRYTRHPNYFGDACVWWGLSLITFSAWPGVLTILSPLVMTWLLARGTGKPLLEKDIAERRPGYVEYVRRTSGFVPLPPKTAATQRSENA